MKKLILTILYVAVFMAAFMLPASARMCVDRAELLKELKKIPEVRVGLGMVTSNGMIEVFTGVNSFTIIVTDARQAHVSCIVAASQKGAWEYTAPVHPGKGA